MEKFFNVLLLALYFILMPCPLRADSLPDSLLTEDAVYEYTFIDFLLARRITDELRTRKMLPAYRLDITEGDLFYNNGYHHQAAKLYLRALESDSVRADAGKQMDLLHRMISCYDGLHNESKKMKYIQKLREKAEATRDTAMQAIAGFNMGKSLYYQGQKEKGIRIMTGAAGLMSRTGYKYKFDNLRYYYNTLILFFEWEKEYENALAAIDSLEQVVDKGIEAGTEMAGLAEKEQKAMFAHRAVVLEQMGRNDEARQNYEKFLALDHENSRDGYLIMPYLFHRKMYDEIIRMNTKREKFLKEQGDTVNYHMTTILKSLGLAYRGVGNHAESSLYFERLAVLRDSLKNREQQSAALELATVYETNAKDIRISKQAAKIVKHQTTIILLLCVSVLLGILLYNQLRHSRIIKKKNNAMANMIKELLKKNEELFRKQEENHLLRKQCKLEDCLEEAKALSPKLPPVEEEDPEQKDAAALRLFEKAEREIMTRQLFLNPDFSRDELQKIVNIPKNKFASLFRTYAGASFPDYINNLRLMYAVKLFQNHPNYTINAIAESCGMSSRTFHRLFLKKFGVTPAEFRKELEKNKEDDSTEDLPSEK